MASSGAADVSMLHQHLQRLKAGVGDITPLTHERTVTWADLLDSSDTSRPDLAPVTLAQKGPSANCLLVLHVAGDLRSTRAAMELFIRSNMSQTTQIRSALLTLSESRDPLTNRLASELGPADVKRCLDLLVTAVRTTSRFPLGPQTNAALSDCRLVCDGLASLQEEVDGEMKPLLRCFTQKKNRNVAMHITTIMAQCESLREKHCHSRLLAPRHPLYPLLHRAKRYQPSFAVVCYASCSLQSEDCELLKYMLDVAKLRNVAAVLPPLVTGGLQPVPELAAANTRQQSTAVYESQALEGITLLAAIKKRLASNNRTFAQFSKMRFYVVVPNLNSLHQQTVKRVCSLDLDQSGEVMKAAQSAATNNALDSICAAIDQHADCLYVVIQDECHWGLTPTGFVNMRIHKQLMNSAHKHHNVVHVCVSATPENHFVIDELRDYNVVKWDTNKDTAMCNAWKAIHGSIATRYYGETLRPKELTKSEQHTVDSEELLSFVAEVYDAQINRKQLAAKTVPSLALMLDYIASFIVHHRPVLQAAAGSARYSPRLDMFSSALTLDALEQCTTSDQNGQGSLCVVRMSCRTSLCTEFLQQFRLIRNMMGLENRCTIMLCAGRASLKSQLEKQFKHRMDQWRDHQSQVPTDLAFGDLTHVPGILILVGKGRMGDTFPSTMSHFDLRACYSGAIIRSTFIQDAGRTFRMAKSDKHLPQLLLRPQAHVAFRDRDYDKPDHTLVEVDTDLAEDDEDEKKIGDGPTVDADDSAEDDSNDNDNSGLGDGDYFTIGQVRGNWKAGKNTAFAVTQPSAEAMAKTVLMFAAPQIGKTGAYLHCCRVVRGIVCPRESHKIAINICYLGQVQQGHFRKESLSSIEAFNREVGFWLQDYGDFHSPSQFGERPTKRRRTGPDGESTCAEDETDEKSPAGHDCYFYTEEKAQDAPFLPSLRGLAAVFESPYPLTANHLSALSSSPVLNASSIVYLFTGNARQRMRQHLPQPVPAIVAGQRSVSSAASMQLKGLHRDYYKEDSKLLHVRFNQNPQLWTNYHQLIERRQTETGLSITERFAETLYQRIADMGDEKKEIEVGDMGCGRCQLAEKLISICQRPAAATNIRVVAGSQTAGPTDVSLIIKLQGVDHRTDEKSRLFGAVQANMQATQWAATSMHMLVFNLSLWGDDRHSYIKEAHRVLRYKGDLFIVESKYRMGIDYSDYDNAEKVKSKCDEFAAHIVRRGFKYDSDFGPAEFLHTPFVCLLFEKTNSRRECMDNQEAVLVFPKQDARQRSEISMPD